MQRNGHETPTPLVTAHTIYGAAALTGLLANTELLHEPDKTTSLAQKYADQMALKDGRGF